MTKQKTKKSVKKRFKITPTGKVLRGHSFNRHLRSKKSSKQKRRLNKITTVHETYAKKIRTIMGANKQKREYGKK